MTSSFFVYRIIRLKYISEQLYYYYTSPSLSRLASDSFILGAILSSILRFSMLELESSRAGVLVLIGVGIIRVVRRPLPNQMERSVGQDVTRYTTMFQNPIRGSTDAALTFSPQLG